MFKNKKILLKIISTSLFATTIASIIGLSLGCVDINKNSTSLLKNSLNEDSSTTTTATDSNTWNDDSLVVSNDYLSTIDTPNGYIKIGNKSITMISWFGTKSWTYDIANSPFLTQANISGYNSSSSTIVTHVMYLSNYERILVYGTVNSTTTYIFQLNIDGSEYYINNNDTNKVANSSLISTRDTDLISSGYAINLLNSSTAIIYPKNLSSDTLTLSATKFSLENFATVPVKYDGSGWKTDNSNSANTFSNYTLGGIVGIYESSDSKNTYLFFKSYSTNADDSTKKNINLMWIKLTNNVYTSINKSVTAIFDASDNKTPDLEHAYFKIVATFDSDSTSVYFAMLNYITDPSCIVPGPVDSTTTTTSFLDNIYALNLKTDTLNTYTSSYTSTTKVTVLNIYVNPYNKRIYALLKNKSDNTFFFSDLFNNTTLVNGSSNKNILRIKNWVNFPTVTDSNDTTRIDLIWIPIFEKNSSIPTTINGIVSVLTFNDSSSSTPNSKTTKRFTISNFDFNSNQTATFQDFSATIINSYSNLVSTYYYMLPQDITSEILEKFIYLVKSSSTTSDSSDKPYESNITLPDDGLTIDNNKGIASGTISLNVKKWWSTSENTEYYTIPISLNLTGLATNSSLSFNLVTSSDVNSTKYQKILELKKEKYPSAISKNEILNYFLDFGGSIKLAEDNISITVEGSQSSTTNDNSSSATKYINVIANDDNGTLQISWNLSNVLSTSITTRSGSYTFNNFKYLNSWQQITLNQQAWTLLKKSKAPFQVSVDDIISCLNLSSSYSTDASKWTWTPTNKITTNKSGYISDNLEGRLSGTIKYNPSINEIPSNISDSIYTLTISESEGSGFLKLSELLGSEASSTMYYDENVASKLASSYNLSKVEENFTNILSSAITFFNGWTTVDSLNFKITSSANNKIEFTLSYKDTIETNLVSGDGTKLILDKDWISQIQSSSTNLLPTSTYSFNYNLTNIQYNYDISETDNTISIEKILSSSTTEDNLNKYMKLMPSKFVKLFFDSETNSYDSFLNVFNLVQLPTDTTALNYYTVSNVQLVADNINGTVIVLYTFSFPNAGDNVDGSSLSSSIILSGFRTASAFSNRLLIICSVMAAIAILLVVASSGGIWFYKRKSTQQINKYHHVVSSRNLKNLSLENPHRKDLNNVNLKNKFIRNTINRDVLKNNGRSNNSTAARYQKLVKDLKKKK